MGMLDSALLGMFLTQMMSAAAFSVIAPYYPSVASDKGLSGETIGLVFSCYPLAAWVTSPLIGVIATRFGRKRTFIAGALLVGVVTTAFALLPLFGYGMFTFLSFLQRLLQGVGGAAIGGASFAIIASGYKERMELMLGIQQSMTSLGMMLGPLIGTGLYYIGGFSFMFIALGCNFLAFIVYACWVLPQDKPYMKADAVVKIQHLMKNSGVMSVGIILIIAFMNLAALAPVFTEHLTTNYDVEKASAGFFFTIPSLSYACVVFIIGRIPQTVSRIKIMILGLYVMLLAMILAGPWIIIGIPRSLAIVVIGLILLGIGLALSILPAMPIMVKKAQEDMPYHNSEHISDAVTGLTLFCLYSGQILGPPISGFFSDKIGFENASVLIGSVSLIYAFIFTFTSKSLRPTIMQTLETPLYQEMVSAKKSELVINEEF
ncbi:unnamed protein product [Blepharisma stoltei]|uniref:Major facilitator superfamily (MFS) profile domain-containing protein n=1 Tax=Blepharisma stoltei TaxID=1481888 RepID=A0AAU9JTK3_9CILI|nr:unnamed protein product [Blepharisma stoltei]